MISAAAIAMINAIRANDRLIERDLSFLNGMVIGQSFCPPDRSRCREFREGKFEVSVFYKKSVTESSPLRIGPLLRSTRISKTVV